MSEETPAPSGAALVPPATNSGRIVSMDQFRGYTVFGMFLVNYLGHFDNVYHTLLHNDFYFSYADTIMPAFIFAVGFSFRLTILKRLPKWGRTKTYLSYAKRSLALILVSIALFGIGSSWRSFSEFYRDPDIILDDRTYGQLLNIPGSELDDEQIKGRIQSLLTEKAKGDLVEGEELSSEQEADIQAETDEQYDMFLASHEEYQKYQAYLQAKERQGEKEKLQEAIDKGLVNKDNLPSEEQELLENDVEIPEYTSAPYFWSHLGKVFALTIKSNLWETLAIIGVTQLLVMPFINLPFWGRFATLVAFGIGHALLTHWFNWQFFFGYTEGIRYVNLDHGLNNWMGEFFGTGSNRGWDGGLFGMLAWGVIMLAGSLSYDILKGDTPKTNVIQLLSWGAGFMVVAYLLSCLANFYDQPALIEVENKEIIEAAGYYSSPEDKDMSVEQFLSSKNAETRAEIEELLIEPAEPSQVQSGRARNHPASPVIPPFSQLGNRSFTSYFAPLPFSKNEELQMQNYWMIWKRIVSLPFTLFASGFAFVVLALFVVLCDIGGVKVPIFRTFGMNPLAAYAIHEVILHNLLPDMLPGDASPSFIFWSLILFLLIVWAMVRSLEKQDIYIRM